MQRKQVMKWVVLVLLLVTMSVAAIPGTADEPQGIEPSAISCGDTADCKMTTPVVELLQRGAGPAFRGRSLSGRVGVVGIGKPGVRGTSGNGAGVEASSTNGYGLKATSTNGSAVYIPNAGYHGIHIVNTGFQGIYIENAGLNGVRAHTWGATIDTAAIRGENVYADGIGVRGKGGYGVVGSSDQGAWAGYFYNNIYVEGSCTGCLLGYIAKNDDTSPLGKGDVVAISGVLDPLEGHNTPVFEVRRAVDAQSAIVGVVQARGRLGQSPDGGGAAVLPGEGVAEPGEYLLIVTQGPIQVKAKAQSGIQVGDLVSVGDSGLVAPAMSESQTIGRALDAVDPATGLVWVLVDLQ